MKKPKWELLKTLLESKTRVSSWDSIQLESSKYNLQPRSKGILDFPRKVAGGLVSLDEKKQKPTQRGIKSYMSMAQKQASSKVRCRKQLSLIGGLRAFVPSEGLK